MTNSEKLVNRVQRSTEKKEKALIVMLPDRQMKEFRNFCDENNITGAGLVRAMIDEVIQSVQKID